MDTRGELTGTDRYNWSQSGGPGTRLTPNGSFDYGNDNIGNRQNHTVDTQATES